MRRFIVVAASTLLFATVMASENGALPASAVALEGTLRPQAAPVPGEGPASLSSFRVLAIGAGAIVGVIAANVISGGMITPILTGASFALPADAAMAEPMFETASAGVVAAQAGIIIVGGAVGAAVGNWLSNGN